MMFNAILTLFTALSMATVAAWFAIAGIMAVFAGAPIPALIMGCVVELGKVVGVSWIYRHWKERTSIKYFMLPAVIVAIFLTSMGIFGFLSKAHLEQTSPVGNNGAQIERLDQRIAREQKRITDAETVVGQLDETVQTLIDFNRISHPETGARAVRAGQEPQRQELSNIINEAEDKITEYEDEKFTLSSELRELELEVGPIKYIAAIIYEDPENSLEEAVRFVILAFIFVFDPMAILLLMGANYQLMKLRPDLALQMIDPDDPKDDDDPDDPGGELLALMEEDEEVEPVDEPVETVEAEQHSYDRSWLEGLPDRDENVDTETLVATIRRLKNRDRTADEQKIFERFRNLATARNIPWDVAKRAIVNTGNAKLQS